ncbi:hypothetical protein JTE90_015834 [Oedothorax gibbosus]|uniref:Uncharacterized protein n=1 Tax=Oedothorax gibbosus TaxID=931172 RepID=A0AAV6TPH0_9ARAC|nr:hypothetical protein JTE90_015834 [Oedothorax gibbosus]
MTGNPSGGGREVSGALVRAQLAPAVVVARIRVVHATAAAGGAIYGDGVRLLLYMPPAVGGGQRQGEYELRGDAGTDIPLKEIPPSINHVSPPITSPHSDQSRSPLCRK